MGPHRRTGWTLIELLVVLAIVALLLALLLPAVQKIREAANRLRCGNHLHQLALALHHYATDLGELPPCTTPGAPPQHTWVALLLPYLEAQPLAAHYHLDHPWDDPVNGPAVGTTLPLLLCPSAPGGRVVITGAGLRLGPVDYQPHYDVDPGLIATGLLGTWRGDNVGAMRWDRRRRLTDVTDGTAVTLLLVEDAGRPQLWRAGREVPGGWTPEAGWAAPDSNINLDGASADGTTFGGPRAINATNVHECYSFHPGGAQVVFADGHVRFLREDIPIALFAALVTRAGGEVVADAEEW
jgi:prepilin-type N-terminal cleavage/methylation domain-containing protein/prepilin-type processing-associated H-X9-DG protein